MGHFDYGKFIPFSKLLLKSMALLFSPNPLSPHKTLSNFLLWKLFKSALNFYLASKWDEGLVLEDEKLFLDRFVRVIWNREETNMRWEFQFHITLTHNMFSNKCSAQETSRVLNLYLVEDDHHHACSLS